MAAKQFPLEIVATIDKSKIIGIRAGDQHRFIGLWVVVVENRVFVRSWSVKPTGWHAAFLENPIGALTIGTDQYDVKAVQTRSERLKDLVSKAYAEKYNTKASLKYVQDLSSEKSRATTTELVPR
jgi:hypothetical protein